MIDDIHFGNQQVKKGGYKIITPKKIHSRKRYYKDYKSVEQQKIDAGEIAPGPSLVFVNDDGMYDRVYDPLEENSLFRIFSNLSTDNHDEIVDFANQYGLLGEGLTDEPLTGTPIEPLSVWSEHIESMTHAIEIWDHIQQDDRKWLSERVIWIGNRNEPPTEAKVQFKSGNRGMTIASKGYREDLLKHLTFGDIIIPARAYLQLQINERIKNRTTIRLMFEKNYSGQHNIITAKNLIGFMWLQFAHSVEGNLKYKKCVVCNTPFRLDPLKRGKPRRFCSNACKTKDYRDRKKIAKQNNE